MLLFLLEHCFQDQWALALGLLRDLREGQLEPNVPWAVGEHPLVDTVDDTNLIFKYTILMMYYNILWYIMAYIYIYARPPPPQDLRLRIRGSWGMGCTKHCNAQKIPKFLIPNLTKPCNAQKIPKIPKFWHLCPGQDHVPENFGIF